MPWRETMYNHGDFQAVAAFGDVIWHVNDRTNLTVGLRYTRDTKEFTWKNGPHETPELDALVAQLQQAGFFDPNVFPIPPEAYRFSDIVFQGDTPADGYTQKDTWSDVSPRLVLDYKITPNVMMFGSVAKGYKAGGYNSVEVASKFDNEDVWNAEVGMKSVLADARVMLNASVFHYIYNDKQGITLVDNGSEVPQYLVDTSDEQATGVDLEAQWLPVEHVTLSANVEYINATYKDKMTAGVDPIDLSGQPTGEPYLTAALGASYGWALGSLGDLNLSGRYAYRGETRCNDDSERQGACALQASFKVGEATQRLDMRLGWTSLDEKYGLAAYVTNVLDDQYVSGVNNITTDTFGTPFTLISEPRMWGVEATVAF
jgi:iron complex outermembrane receptor protein